MSFETEVVGKLKEVYPEAEIRVSDVIKANKTLRGINVAMPGSNIAPTLYVEDFEAAINRGQLTFDQAVAKMISMFDEALAQIPQMPDINKETVLGSVQWRLMNRDRNTDISLTSPSRDFCDLMQVPYLSLKMSDAVGSARVTNSLIEYLGITEGELFAACDRNARPIVKSMKETLKETMLRDMPKGTTEEDLDRMLDGMPDGGMYVCTNMEKVNGASMFLCGSVMEKMAGIFDDNVVILPSSVHEVIMIPEGRMEPDAVQEMVGQVNAECVRNDDFLSDNAYLYDREKKAFREFGREQEI